MQRPVQPRNPLPVDHTAVCAGTGGRTAWCTQRCVPWQQRLPGMERTPARGSHDGSMIHAPCEHWCAALRRLALTAPSSPLSPPGAEGTRPQNTAAPPPPRPPAPSANRNASESPSACRCLPQGGIGCASSMTDKRWTRHAWSARDACQCGAPSRVKGARYWGSATRAGLQGVPLAGWGSSVCVCLPGTAQRPAPLSTGRPELCTAQSQPPLGHSKVGAICEGLSMNPTAGLAHNSALP